MAARCKICAAGLLPAESALYAFPNVTSDCRPWRAGRSIALCQGCGVMQREVLPEAEAFFADVYQDYEMFKHAQAASDQMNFNLKGISEGRTQKILKFIDAKLSRRPSSVLDIGSGSGAGLIALAQQFPTASIYGYEPNDNPAERQKNLPENVVSILRQRPEGGKQYDLVTLFHVFEHIEDLSESLAFVASILPTGGHLLIQVPYAIRGPFDLVIADHIWHFSKKSLVSVLGKANFNTVYIGNDLIEKELTVLATPGAPKNYPLPAADETQQGMGAIQWLVQYKAFLDDLKIRERSLMIYGTGPAGAWAGHVLGESVKAYIDEDQARVGSTFNSKPVLSPQQIDRTIPIVAPFPDYQVHWIAERNKGLNIVLFKNTLHAA